MRYLTDKYNIFGEYYYQVLIIIMFNDLKCLFYSLISFIEKSNFQDNWTLYQNSYSYWHRTIIDH